ncbi:50S ribosomal protein L9 [bioreactor metagenome]|uniref:50S ribosomal protein L9 n=1 Tax=bioreactor metagenome TaxID=1076179 RepID=A0A645HS08_9ZZZZ
MQASEDGQLFGSISARAIADKLSSDFGVEIEHSKIKLEDNIKALGTFVVDVKLHHDVTAQLSLVVVRG